MTLTWFLLVVIVVAKLCPTHDPLDCSPSGSSVHGILQVRILEWVAMPFSRGSSQPRDGTCLFCVSCIAGRFFTTEPLEKPLFIPTASQRRHGYHSHFTVEGTASQRREGNGQMSNDWKQQSPNYNPKPPKPKALPLSLQCDCHVPSWSLGRLK